MLSHIIAHPYVAESISFYMCNSYVVWFFQLTGDTQKLKH